MDGVGLAAASLPIGKASDLGSEEGALHNGPNTLLIHLHVGEVLRDGVIEFEVMLIDVFGEIYLRLLLSDDDAGAVLDLHHIGLVACELLLVERPLPDHYPNFRMLGVSLRLHR